MKNITLSPKDPPPGDLRGAGHRLLLPPRLPLRLQPPQEGLGCTAGTTRQTTPMASTPLPLAPGLTPPVQEALASNVALEDINRTALVRLKQVPLLSPSQGAPHLFLITTLLQIVSPRAWRRRGSSSPTTSRPRTPRRTSGAAASALSTGRRCEET